MLTGHVGRILHLAPPRSCPICRQVLPAGPVTAFPCNFALLDLVSHCLHHRENPDISDELSAADLVLEDLTLGHGRSGVVRAGTLTVGQSSLKVTVRSHSCGSAVRQTALLLAIVLRQSWCLYKLCIECRWL